MAYKYVYTSVCRFVNGKGLKKSTGITPQRFRARDNEASLGTGLSRVGAAKTPGSPRAEILIGCGVIQSSHDVGCASLRSRITVGLHANRHQTEDRNQAKCCDTNG